MGKTEQKSTTLEKGNIYFFYRPKVGVEAPRSVDDVQRLYMLLSPDEKNVFRLAIIGQKIMPQPEEHQRFWGYIQTVARKPEDIKTELGPETYSTRTRGERHIGPARPAGEGRYRILRHDDHTHFAYALELPRKEGDVQESFNIADQASYIISVKNPEAGQPSYAGLRDDEQARFPKRIMKVFGEKKFADADPPDMLDYEGAEFVLIGATEDVKSELGVEFQTQDETSSSADIFTELKLDRKSHPLKPLFEGKWQ